MAQTVLRAAQTSYATNVDGGSRDQAFVIEDLGPFMDSIEREDTPFLNSLTKGPAGNQLRHSWMNHGVMPRGSRVSGAVTAAVTTLPILPGHGVRFQQAHVIEVTRASDNASEVMWVTADPGPDGLPVRRARGGTTALAFAAQDKVKVIGIAIPQLVDFPLSPVSRGSGNFNYFEELAGHLELSHQARVTPNKEFPSGDWLDRDMLQLGKNMKETLEQTLLLSRRQAGTPDPSAPDPSMMGGLRFFAELGGNVYNVGGPAVKLTIEALEEALIQLDESVGSNAGKLLLMNIRTKQIFNRLLHPSRYQGGVGPKDTSVNLTWDSVTTETGTYKFTHSRNIPLGEIYLYDKSNLRYLPFAGNDWKEKDVPTKGNWSWKGMSANYTFEAKDLNGMALIRNFDTNLGNYTKFGAAA